MYFIESIISEHSKNLTHAPIDSTWYELNYGSKQQQQNINHNKRMLAKSCHGSSYKYRHNRMSGKDI